MAMDYLTFESFIHPSVVEAFLVKEPDIPFTVTQDSFAGSDTVVVGSAEGIFSGDSFLLGGITYTIRAADKNRNTLLIKPELGFDVRAGVELIITKKDCRDSLVNFYNLGVKDYQAFVKSLLDWDIPFRHDADVYVLKSGFIAMYKWILHNKAFLRRIDLTGIGIAKDQIFDHFYQLLEYEKEEYDQMREEALEELARKQEDDAAGRSGTGFVRYNAPNRRFFGGYYNGRRW